MKTGMMMLLVFLAATRAGAETLPNFTSTFAAAPDYSREVFAAARYAARDRNVRVLKVRSAEIVEEASFKLCLSVRDESAPFLTRATVMRDSTGHYSLTRWFPGGC